MAIVLVLVGALVALALLIAAFGFLVQVAKWLAIASVALFAAPAALPGFICHRMARWIRATRWAEPLLAAMAALLALASLAPEEGASWPMLYAITAVLSSVVIAMRWRAKHQAKQVSWSPWVRLQIRKFDVSSHIALWLVIAAFVAEHATREFFADPYQPLFGWAYWLASALVQVYTALRFRDLSNVIADLEAGVTRRMGDSLSDVTSRLKASAATLDDEIDEIATQHVAAHALEGRMVEVELSGARRLFCARAYANQMEAFRLTLTAHPRHDDNAIAGLSRHFLKLDGKDGVELLTHHARIGRRHQFADGHYFVAYANAGHLETCASCGLARWFDAPRPDTAAKEWFCSDICKQTESTCLEIHAQPPHSFLSDAMSRGFTLVGGSDAWVRNHRMVAAGGQGHGHAAENGNTLFDRVTGNKASVVGADNRKHGPDRLVNGVQVQTKYCRTPARSVGEAFDGSAGLYKYRNADGTPMQLEVPADQYHDAVRVMENKIRQGRVEGVTDPEQAKDIVRPGHLTYEQAANIVKFGSFESLCFDAAEGAIIGLGAASISFCISSALVYLRTGDARVAVQAAALQAGKAGLVTAGSYVAAQQLHRLELVQSALKCIDVSCLSPTLRDVLQTGMGVSTKGALNHALRGTVVTSVISIGVATGPDLYRLIRQEITFSQLKRTIVTATSGTVGAFVGSVAGGAIGAPAGPLGVFVGRVVGGFAGGAGAAMLVDMFFAEQKERERELANRYFRTHLEYLAGAFALTQDEVRSVVRNFLKLSDEKTHQKILAANFEGRAYLNAVLKPIVVGVVKQRDCLRLEAATGTELALAA